MKEHLIALGSHQGVINFCVTVPRIAGIMMGNTSSKNIINGNNNDDHHVDDFNRRRQNSHKGGKNIFSSTYNFIVELAHRVSGH